MTTVAIVGAGAVGITAARDLAARGADVTVFERGDPAAGASGRAAGIVYDAFAEDTDVAVAARAMERFRALADDGAITLVERPYLWFARAGDGRRAEAVREQVPRMRSNDRDVALLDPTAVAARLPGHGPEEVAVGALARDAACLEPSAYVEAMADRAATAGATVRTGTPVALAGDGTAVETPDGRRSFDTVLVAAGAHARRLLAGVNVSIPVKPYRVQAVQTGPAGADLPIWYDATESYYARPRRGGVLVGDGTEEREVDPETYDETADDAFVETSRERVAAAVGERPPVERAWAGVCTATPDRNPLVGPVDRGGLFVATGWHGHGFMRAPALGEKVAEQILGGDGVEAFDPRRFDGDEEFAVIEGMTVD